MIWISSFSSLFSIRSCHGVATPNKAYPTDSLCLNQVIGVPFRRGWGVRVHRPNKMGGFRVPKGWFSACKGWCSTPAKAYYYVSNVNKLQTFVYKLHQKKIKRMVYVSVIIPEMVWKKIQFNRVYMEIPKIPRPIATYIIDGAIIWRSFRTRDWQDPMGMLSYQGKKHDSKVHDLEKYVDIPL